LAHLHAILALFYKIHDLLQSILNVALRVVHKLFDKTMQKLSAKLSNGGPHGISEKGGPEATASFASPDIYPCTFHSGFELGCPSSFQ